MLNVAEALEKIVTSVTPVAAETKSLENSLGCVLATDIASPSDSPPFDKSMMDGYAVIAQDISVGDNEFEVVDEVTAGREAKRSLRSGESIRIMTGAPVPEGATAVIPIEQSRLNDPGNVSLTVESSVPDGLNIIRRGSNMRAGETVLSRGRVVRPQEVALLAEMGQAEVQIHRKPRVAILATGDELVPVSQTPGPGQIRNSNALMLASQVESAGAESVILGIARDEREDLREKIQRGLDCDFLCLSGGVSAGKLDLVPSELEAAGVEEVFHKVAMKPGKPIWFGVRRSDNQCPCYVFGLPGNPVSSMVCFELFVRTALRRFAAIEPATPKLMKAVLTKDFQQAGDREVWFPARIELSDGKARVTPVNWKGSSDLRSTADANSSVRFIAERSNFKSGELLDVLPWGRLF